MVFVGSLARLVPFIWQQRRSLLVSVVLAGIVALAAVASLMLVYPVVTVLLQGQSFAEHIELERQAAQEAVEERTTTRDELQRKLERLRNSGSTYDIARCEAELATCLSELKSATLRERSQREIAERWLPWLPDDRFQLLGLVMLALLLMTAIKCSASYLQDVLVGAIVQRTMQSLRERLFRRTLQLDQQTLALETTPQLMARFTFDLQQVSLGLTLLGSKAVLEPLKAVFCVVGAFIVNWRLTALSFVCAPFAVLLFGRFGSRLKKASRRQMESMSRVYRVLDETLSSFRMVLAFRNERLHRRRLARENRDYFGRAMKIVRIDSLANPSVEFLAMTAIFAASLPGAYLVLRQKTSIAGVTLTDSVIDAPQLALLYTLLAGILDPARKLANVYSKVKKATAACDRVFGWMDRKSLLTRTEICKSPPRHHDAIEFDSVTFRYATIDTATVRPSALDDVSVRIPFGAIVAIVGGNGSGKSTLVNLLPRFFDNQSGTVRIDGVDIQTIDPRLLRSQMAVVTQETLLFDRTIVENIAYGCESASREEIESAARRAHVLDFAKQMPDRLDTVVGDRGHRLSGGQRQRVALARAILRDPAILILDEATSAVDVQSEQLIHESLRDLACHRTTLIVTHALTSQLLNVISHVLVMESGRVIAFGRHEDVLATCPAYQRLMDAQSHRRAA